MTRPFAILCTFFLSFNLLAQTVEDALRYSILEIGGTARTVGVGGALGALGADYAIISTNPAGLSRFRSSEIVVTPTFEFISVDSKLEGGETNKETAPNFNFNNVGVVFFSQPRGAKWQSFNFAIGFNRLANFRQDFRFKGETVGSYTDRFVEIADGLFPDDLDDFEAGPAFDVGAIYNIDPNDQTAYGNDFFRNPAVYKEQLVKSSGSYNELVFSMAGNYNEKLMVGLTLGIPFISYDLNKTYIERDEGDEIDFFNELQFRDNVSTSGVGINAKFGLIYHITKMVRAGVAVHSPSFFSLTDNFSTRILYDFTDDNNDGALESESPQGNFEYKLRTPFRAIGSLGVIINKLGFLSGELEYIDYTMASFNLTANSSNPEDAAYEEELNDEIDNSFDSSINFRLGGEYALKNLRFRAGFGLTGTPYAAKDITTSSYSLGFGWRQEGYYVDLAYRRSMMEEEYIPYSTAIAPQQRVNNDLSKDKIMLTLGFKF